MRAVAPEIQSLVEAISAINPVQQRYLELAIDALETEEIETLHKYIRYCLDHEHLEIPYLARAYDQIVKDMVIEQVYFLRHGKYRHSTLAAVENDVYKNPDYMKLYMYGLALTLLLWPNHSAMRRYFRAQLPRGIGGDYLEIGPGHGFNFVEAMRLSGYNRFLGVDISPTSVELTKSILGSGYFGPAESSANRHVEIRECDFLKWQPEQQFDAVVTGEVLEHVEDPKAFFEKIRAVAKPDAFIFVTTCINAPAKDHIYLYASKEQLKAEVEDAGFTIKDWLLVPYGDLSLEVSERDKLPINVSLVLSPKQ